MDSAEWMVLAKFLSLPYGEMKATKTIWPEAAKSLETSEILLMFSALSSAEKPRSLLRPFLMTSPSRMKTLCGSPRSVSNLALSALERVDLPAPERPVNQMVAPFLSSKPSLVLWCECDSTICDFICERYKESILNTKFISDYFISDLT